MAGRMTDSSVEVVDKKKRPFDIIISIIGLILLMPLFIVILGLIKLTSPGPIFYRALRVGQTGKPFRLYKFRTMVANADQQGPSITRKADSRITPIGHLLRRTKLDELPQLFNVLKGDMSLVGPRPEDPRYVALYTPEQRQVLQVRPGITSAASLTYRHEEQMLAGENWETVYRRKVMPAKLAIDLHYLTKRTLATDCILILYTLAAMFKLQVVPDINLLTEKGVDQVVKNFLRKQYAYQKFYPIIIWDAVITFALFFLALAFRFDGQIPTNYLNFFWQTIPFIIFLYVIINIFFKLYDQLWRYASAYELISIVYATVTSTGLLASITLMYDLRSQLPLGVVLLGGLLVTGGFTAIRYRQRLLTGVLRRLQNIVGTPDRQRVLIVGAGEAGQMLAHQFQMHGQNFRYKLIGFVDDDPKKVGLWLHGVSVLGDTQDIPELVTGYEIKLMVIAIHNLSGPALRDILTICLETGARVKLLPDFFGNMDKLNSTMPLKDISPEDLLGRPSHQVDHFACQQIITGKTVLVTGAAGSIGSELCRQIWQLHPRKLFVLDNNETGLHDLTLSFKQGYINNGNSEIIPLIADVTNRNKLDQTFASYQPQVIFHAAAYKHVPLMESHPDEAIRVNVGGTKNVAELASRYQAERFVLISSDKAVNPSSVMGATKRLGELIITEGKLTKNLNGHHQPTFPSNGFAITHKPINGISKKHRQTLFTAVRFGNVLGSRGSVVPTFTKQIEQGGPITITHPEMARYFMSISEAVSLVIQAATLTKGGDLFMLDMGQEIRIVDLAHKMIRLRGLRPYLDIPIVYTGLRPGEKLREELHTSNENQQPTTHPSIFCIQEKKSFKKPNFSQQITDLITSLETHHPQEAANLMWQIIYGESETAEATPPLAVLEC